MLLMSLPTPPPPFNGSFGVVSVELSFPFTILITGAKLNPDFSGKYVVGTGWLY